MGNAFTPQITGRLVGHSGVSSSGAERNPGLLLIITVLEISSVRRDGMQRERERTMRNFLLQKENYCLWAHLAVVAFMIIIQLYLDSSGMGMSP